MAGPRSQIANHGEGTVVVGAYHALWDDLDVGSTVDGFTVNSATTAIPITSDSTGTTIVDEIHTGLNMTISMVLQHWNAQAIEPMIWWHGNSRPVDYEWGTTDGVGQSRWAAAKPLILYACDAVGFANSVGELDAGDIPQDAATTITRPTGASVRNPFIDPLDMIFYKTILRKDENLEIILANRPRYLPITLEVMPVKRLTGTDFTPNTPDNELRPNGCGRMAFFNATRGASPSVTP